VLEIGEAQGVTVAALERLKHVDEAGFLMASLHCWSGISILEADLELD
jgi:hypothetical protein